MSDSEPNPPAETRPRFERKATLRLGQRELSRLSLAVVLVVAAGLLFGGYRLYRNLKSTRDVLIASDNMRAIYKALYNYAQDWDGRLPPAARWSEAVQGYLGGSEGQRSGTGTVLRGPGDGALVGYAYNELASGYNLEATDTKRDLQLTLGRPSALVLLVERPGAEDNATVRIPPLPGGEEVLGKTLQYPHFSDSAKDATTIVLFASGSTTRFKRPDFDPQAATE